MYPPRLSALLGGATLAASWLLPDSMLTVLFGWISAFFFVLCVSTSNTPLKDCFIGGLLSTSLSFYWLVGTIVNFGHFPIWAALLIYALFIAGTSLQFLIFAALFRYLPGKLSNLCLKAPFAWLAAEYISPSIFPWHIGHTQLGFLEFAQLSSVGGTQLISFFMLFSAECLTRLYLDRSKASFLRLAFIASIFLVSISWGKLSIDEIESQEADNIHVAIIQGNIAIEEKHDANLTAQNIVKYISLSREHQDGETLLVWPESVITDWIPVNTKSLKEDPRLLPLSNLGPLLTGALTFESKEKYFNSAIGVNADDSLVAPYHKIVLMPYGEFTPFSETFPFFKSINDTAADFTPGKGAMVLSLRSKAGREIKLAPLICYEDLIQGLSRDATRAGAALLVNLTNDAWFGNTRALYQHHRIAAFRAIENRRYLIRATNTGFSSVIDATGRTSSATGTYSEGRVLADVPLLGYSSLYTRYPLILLWKLLSWIVLLSSFCNFFWRRYVATSCSRSHK